MKTNDKETMALQDELMKIATDYVYYDALTAIDLMIKKHYQNDINHI